MITKAATIPKIDPDAQAAAVEAATHEGLNGDGGPAPAAGIGRAPRLDAPRQRVMVNLPPDVIPELDRRAAEYGYSRSMYILRILSNHFDHLRDEEQAEIEAREARAEAKRIAEEKRAAKRIAAKKAARARARAAAEQ